MGNPTSMPAEKLPPIEKMARAGETTQCGPDEMVFKESVSKRYASDGKPIEYW